MSTPKTTLQFLGNVLPEKVESVVDVTAVDYAQMTVHFAPSLCGRLCFDPDAPPSTQRNSLELVLKEVENYHPAVKYSKVTPELLLKKDPKACGALCEAFFKMNSKTPFPRSYNAKAERGRLLRRAANGVRKRPLEETAANKGAAGSSKVVKGSASTQQGKKDDVTLTAGSFHACEQCFPMQQALLSAPLQMKKFLWGIQQQTLSLLQRGVDPDLVCELMGDHLNRMVPPPAEAFSSSTLEETHPPPSSSS